VRASVVNNLAVACSPASATVGNAGRRPAPAAADRVWVRSGPPPSAALQSPVKPLEPRSQSRGTNTADAASTGDIRPTSKSMRRRLQRHRSAFVVGCSFVIAKLTFRAASGPEGAAPAAAEE